jgi:hypothetical protein
MASDKRNFDPYIAWEDISDVMVDDLHAKIVEYKKAQDDFLTEKNRENASRLMRLQFELNVIATGIHKTLYRMPVMVHIADEKIETHEEEHEIKQRCARCGSILQFWKEGMAIVTPAGPIGVSEDDISWWDPGDIVAKATDDEGMTVYQVDPKRSLDKWERECVDLSEVVG